MQDAHLHFDQLKAGFLQAARSPDECKLGLELEFFVVDSQSLKSLPFDGPGGIESLLAEFVTRFGWNPILENERLIALERQELKITIEPSGAVEFVFPPYKTLDRLAESVAQSLDELTSCLEGRRASALGIGFLPFNTVDDAPLVPKSRYDFMYRYMPEVGQAGREMMKLTASVQVSIDYTSEQDAMRKLRLAARSIPFLVAFAADSCVAAGSFSGYASRRAWVWEHTDKARTGIPEFLWRGCSSFQDYVDWALDVPMYFLERAGRKIPMQGQSFRSFLSGEASLPPDISDTRASLQDWELHLSTLFPWIRLRRYLEIRAFDQSCPIFVCALAGLVKGLFYSELGLQFLEDRISWIERADYCELLQAGIESGLDACIPERLQQRLAATTFRDFCRDMLEFVRDQSSSVELVEKPFLKPLEYKLNTWSLAKERQAIERDAAEYVRRRFIGQLSCTEKGLFRI